MSSVEEIANHIVDVAGDCPTPMHWEQHKRWLKTKIASALDAERDAHDKTKHEFERVRIDLKRWAEDVRGSAIDSDMHCWDSMTVIAHQYDKRRKDAVASERAKFAAFADEKGEPMAGRWRFADVAVNRTHCVFEPADQSLALDRFALDAAKEKR